MEFLDNRLVIGFAAVAVLYVLFRILTSGKSGQVYEQQVEQILTADEYKVKGRFE